MSVLARRLACLVVVCALAGIGLAAAPASADYRQIKIREVHEGSVGQADYVVLQMFAAEQNAVMNRWLVTYDSAGNPFQMFKFPNNVAIGQSQRTILIAEALMDDIGVTPDLTAGPNFFPGPQASVCYEAIFDTGNFTIDCVAIGSVAPPYGNPSLVGSPVLPLTGLQPGQSVIRSIARGCPTLLEDADDTNNSAADFALGTPSPRRNSMAPTEKPCDGTAPPPGSDFKCRDKRATLIGTKGKDDIKGTGKRDVIVVFDGKDTVNGRAGNDLICGNGGKDSLSGGKGVDTLVGGAGVDNLVGGAGGDKLIGQKGSDNCTGGPGTDVEASC